MSTPTPRTSSAIIASGFQAVPEGFRAFAGILERELTALTAERDKLRAQNDQFSDNLSAVGAVYNAEKARAERAEAEAERYRLVTLRQDAELTTERARLKEMAAELAHCAGYIASVRTDRLITWHEELYALQTLEWAEGAFEIAEKANAVLEAHDAAMKEDAK